MSRKMHVIHFSWFVVLLLAMGLFTTAHAVPVAPVAPTAVDAPAACDGQETLVVDEKGMRLEASSCLCPTGRAPQIAHGWGCASTCAEATQACSNATYSDVNCYHGVCEYGDITYNQPGCIYNHSMCPGQYLMDCDREYWCFMCPFEPEP